MPRGYDFGGTVEQLEDNIPSELRADGKARVDDYVKWPESKGLCLVRDKRASSQCWRCVQKIC